MSPAPTKVVAVDVGGTFTDVYVLDQETGGFEVRKVASTPDPIDGVLAGVKSAGVELSDVALFCHGTTVATNALITRRLPKAAMVTTEGFRDVIEIRRGTRDDLWDAYKDNAPPYIRRRDRFEVPERIDRVGTVLTPLDEDAMRALARKLRRRGAETIAVCFMNSYANPMHEQRAAAILAEEIGDDVPISTSSGVLPELFEHERFSTTVANAVLTPLVSTYVSDLAARLAQGGYGGDLLILHSGGGVMTPEAVEKLAVRLAASGIAAGAVACRHTAELCGYPNAIGLDMGGTSTDISLVYGGELRVTNDWYVEYGYPICLPSIEVLTIGAGGGSLAYLDTAGSLRSGPQSAGAAPGPAAYDTGGSEPTTTDANLVLGRLGSELAGGQLTLKEELARKAIDEQIGAQLGFTTEQAADAIIEVANANMADAVRLISLQRGYDPREFVLVVFGGGGGAHGAALAKELSIPTVIVPPSPGAWSALGCLMVDIRHDLSTMMLASADEVDADEVEREFAALEAKGSKLLASEGVPNDRVRMERSIAMRYLGQWRSMKVRVGAPIGSLKEAIETFHREHEREFSYRRDGAAVELYRLELSAVGLTDDPELPQATKQADATMPTAKVIREVWFGGNKPVATPIYDRSTLPVGVQFVGPAVIEQLDSTTVVPPSVLAEIDEHYNIRMHITEGS